MSSVMSAADFAVGGSRSLSSDNGADTRQHEPGPLWWGKYGSLVANICDALEGTEDSALELHHPITEALSDEDIADLQRRLHDKLDFVYLKHRFVVTVTAGDDHLTVKIERTPT